MRDPVELLAVAAMVGACASGSGTSDDRSAEPESGADSPPTAATVDVERLTCWEASPSGARGGEITFEDVTREYGLVTPLAGMHGHASAWGDANADGRPDLFVGTFADRPQQDYRRRGAPGPSPDVVLRLGDAGFDAAGLPEVHGRTSGAVFADLDADGLLDLVAARIPREGARADTPTTVYSNVGNGALEPVADNGIDTSLAGRSIGVLDFDNDNLLDLFVVEDPYEGGSSRLYRNLGSLQFQDVTQAAGLPLDVGGLGLASGDVNLDGWTDLFVGGASACSSATAWGSGR